MVESLLGGEEPPLFSTQQRMLLLGHCTCDNDVLSKEIFISDGAHLLEHGVAHKAGESVDTLARAGGHICSLCH